MFKKVKKEEKAEAEEIKKEVTKGEEKPEEQEEQAPIVIARAVPIEEMINQIDDKINHLIGQVEKIVDIAEAED